MSETLRRHQIVGPKRLRSEVSPYRDKDMRQEQFTFSSQLTRPLSFDLDFKTALPVTTVWVAICPLHLNLY